MAAEYYSFSDKTNLPKNTNICLDTNFLYNLRIKPHDKTTDEFAIHTESKQFYSLLKQNKNILYISLFSIEEALHLLFKHYLILLIMQKKNIDYDDAGKIWHKYYKYNSSQIPKNHFEGLLSGFVGWISKEKISIIDAKPSFSFIQKAGANLNIDVVSILPKIIAQYALTATDACILCCAVAYNIKTFVSNDHDFLRFKNMDILGKKERTGSITVFMPTILYDKRSGRT